MPQQPGVTRRSWLLASLWAPARMGPPAPSLVVRLEGDRLRVAAPHLRFLTGQPLERLRNGATVTFAFQLTLSTDARIKTLTRSFEQFAASYDLWEENFSVTRLGAPSRSASHLSATAAEAWCIENLSVSAAGLVPQRPFWVRLELRAEDPKERGGSKDEPDLALTRLIELFSRPARPQQMRHEEEAGPLCRVATGIAACPSSK